MKRVLSCCLIAVLVCAFAPQSFAAAQEKKQTKAVKRFIDDQQTAPAVKTKEELELIRLLHPTKREYVLAELEPLLARLKKEDVSAADCFFMGEMCNSYSRIPYIVADTGLDLKYFSALVNVFNALSKNAADTANLPKTETHRLKQEKAALLRRLSSLVENPIDASPALVKEQQKAKKDRIKELRKIIAEQKEEAKRNARSSAVQQ